MPVATRRRRGPGSGRHARRRGSSSQSYHPVCAGTGSPQQPWQAAHGTLARRLIPPVANPWTGAPGGGTERYGVPMTLPGTPARPFGAVLTAMVTPMTSTGEIDLKAAASLARRLVDEGNDGLVLSGT